MSGSGRPRVRADAADFWRAARLRLRPLGTPFHTVLHPPLRWLARQEAVVLLTALGIVLTLYGFIEVAEEMRSGDMRHFDESLLRALRRPDDLRVPVGPAWLPEMMTEVTALGGTAVILVVLLFSVGYLALEGKYGAAALVIVASSGGGLMTVGLKQLFARGRPDVVPHLITVDSLSFPSGHSMATAVIYLTLGALLARFSLRRRSRIYVVGLALTVTFLVGITRVYLGVHYPSDVLAGWAAGLGWALCCWLAARYLQDRGAVETPGRPAAR
jgi:undecaprenyl-diphosphatase